MSVHDRHDMLHCVTRQIHNWGNMQYFFSTDVNDIIDQPLTPNKCHWAMNYQIWEREHTDNHPPNETWLSLYPSLVPRPLPRFLRVIITLKTWEWPGTRLIVPLVVRYMYLSLCTSLDVRMEVHTKVCMNWFTWKLAEVLKFAWKFTRSLKFAKYACACYNTIPSRMR